MKDKFLKRYFVSNVIVVTNTIFIKTSIKRQRTYLSTNGGAVLDMET